MQTEERLARVCKVLSRCVMCVHCLLLFGLVLAGTLFGFYGGLLLRGFDSSQKKPIRVPSLAVLWVAMGSMHIMGSHDTIDKKKSLSRPLHWDAGGLSQSARRVHLMQVCRQLSVAAHIGRHTPPHSHRERGHWPVTQPGSHRVRHRPEHHINIGRINIGRQRRLRSAHTPTHRQPAMRMGRDLCTHTKTYRWREEGLHIEKRDGHREERRTGENDPTDRQPASHSVTYQQLVCLSVCLSTE